MAVALIRRPRVEQEVLRAENRARFLSFLPIVRYEGETCTSTDNETERIRSVFGLSVDYPLPRVNVRNLRTYRRYLADSLSFPFEALYAEAKPPYGSLLAASPSSMWSR